MVQEFLYGDEYIVDTVSLDGEHRLAGLWRYMKGAVNGADFVYYGMELVDGGSDEAKMMFAYISQVLDALNIRHYAGHAEVMLDPAKGPCLVEVGARLQGGEGLFIPTSKKCVGHSQVDLLVMAAADPEAFKALPKGTETWRSVNGYGAVLDLISYREGIVDMVDPMAMTELQSIPAFLSVNSLAVEGQKIFKTVDCFTIVGSVSLWSLDKKEVEESIQRVRDIERRLYVLRGQGLKSGQSPPGESIEVSSPSVRATELQA